MPNRTAVERAENQLTEAIKSANEQITFMRNLGANLEGYVRNYGSLLDVVYYGDGGEAIYLADVQELSNRINAMQLAIQRLKHNVDAKFRERRLQVRGQITREETSH